MKTLTRIGFGVFLVALTTIVPISAANAACVVDFYAERAVYTGTTAFLYGRTLSSATFFYYGSTTNSTMASLLFAAAAQRSRVYIVGSAASCPNTGTFRSIGVLSSATISP